MKRLTTLIALFAAVMAWAQKPYHRDLGTISIEAQTARQEIIFYPTEDAAIKGLEDGPAENPYYLNLNGTWDFAYYTDGEKIPENFQGINWTTIKVPGNWEVQGFGYPIYVNQPYEFAPSDPKPPVLPEEIEAGVYRRTFDLPEGWNKESIYLTLAGASAGVYVYVNGSEVGYHEDSKDAARYDISSVVKEKGNELIIKIFRWSTGSYLECQDFWRISGIERDVYLTCEENIPEDFDYYIVSTFGPDLKDGIFRIEFLGTSGLFEEVSYKLMDGDKTVLEGNGHLGDHSLEGIVPDAKKWSAETPNLYTLILKINGSYTAMDVGFRRFEITKTKVYDKEYPVFLVNGQPVKFKGVNYHEHNPLTGHYVDKGLILKDLLLMKSFNINAIRTCHYPQPREFYELCDRLGFYIYDEANIESHGMGYRLDKTLGNKPDWGAKHLDRVMNMYRRTGNYPCVTILSLGNEAGNGVNFYDCYRALKELEKDRMNRPVCYERAEREWNTDMLVPQYPGADWFWKMGEMGSDRPVIPNEYAHAMGNSTGSLDWQWKCIYMYPNLQGAFIWDWVDQGLFETDDSGRGYFTYGGDYGKNLPSDGNFLCNGIVNPDRDPHPACAEVKWNYQNVTVYPKSKWNAVFNVYNRFYFRSLKGLTLEWSFERLGKRMAGGSIALTAEAQQKETIQLRSAAKYTAEGGIFYFRVKEGGEVIASDCCEIEVSKKPYQYSYNGVKINDDGSNIVLSAEKTSVVFNKEKSLLVSYCHNGKELIDTAFGLRPNFWRAPTDNDYGNGMPLRSQHWKKASKDFKASTAIKEIEGVPALAVTYSLPEEGVYKVEYSLDDNGVLLVNAALEGCHSKDVEIPRVGFRFRTGGKTCDYDGAFEYFGRGPEENYQDRYEGTLPGIYKSNAEASYYPYVRPQETGHHTGARWLTLGNVLSVAAKEFEFNVLGCSTEDLDSEEADAEYMWLNQKPNEEHDTLKARNVYRKHHHINDVPVRDYVEVCIDYKMTGVGGYDSWGSRPEQMRTLWSNMQHSFSFALVPESSSANQYVNTHEF